MIKYTNYYVYFINKSKIAPENTQKIKDFSLKSVNFIKNEAVLCVNFQFLRNYFSFIRSKIQNQPNAT